MPTFKPIVERDYLKLRQINTTLLEGIALGLGVDANSFTKLMHHDRAYTTLRFLHYVERYLSPEEFKDINRDGDIVRGGEHTDTFVNTLIISRQPGLRIRKNSDLVWYKAPIVDEGRAILFFAADMLEILTNGVVKAGVYQVIVDNSLLNGNHVSSRLSIALFNYAKFGETIAPLPEFIAPGERSKFKPTSQERHSQGIYLYPFISLHLAH